MPVFNLGGLNWYGTLPFHQILVELKQIVKYLHMMFQLQLILIVSLLIFETRAEDVNWEQELLDEHLLNDVPNVDLQNSDDNDIEVDDENEDTVVHLMESLTKYDTKDENKVKKSSVPSNRHRSSHRRRRYKYE